MQHPSKDFGIEDPRAADHVICGGGCCRPGFSEFSQEFNASNQPKSALEVFDGDSVFDGMEGDVGLADMDAFSGIEMVSVDEDAEGVEVVGQEAPVELDAESGQPVQGDSRTNFPTFFPVEPVESEQGSGIVEILDNGRLAVDLGVATAPSTNSRKDDDGREDLRVSKNGRSISLILTTTAGSTFPKAKPWQGREVPVLMWSTRASFPQEFACIQTHENFTQGSGGELVIEIGGTTAGDEFDQVQVTNLADLDGKLTIQLINDYTPTVGDTFEILTFGTVNGSFADASGLYGFSDDMYFDIDETASGITLTALELVLGEGFSLAADH